MKSIKTISLVAVVFLFIFVSTGLAKGPMAKPFIPDIPKTWTPVDPAVEYPTFNYNGLTPACSNGLSAANDKFFFFVKGGTVNNVVVYFQGGGACWDPLTCLIFQPYSQDCSLTDIPAGYGIFDFTNPENLFKDWTYVFIPYCTGDIHWGANDKTYTYGPITHTIQHRGFVNFMVVLQWMTNHIDKPHKIFITGSSAGSYGAIAGFPWIKEAYPISQVSVLGDAGMGVSPPEFSFFTTENWKTQVPPWIFDTTQGYPTTPEMWKTYAEYYPHSKLAEFTTAYDGTQIWFYDFMFTTLGLSHPANVALDWHQKMWEGLEYKSGAPNYRYYVADGTYHTILGTPYVYTEESTGVPFLYWLEAMVKNQGGTNGKGAVPWFNLECPTCQ